MALSAATIAMIKSAFVDDAPDPAASVVADIKRPIRPNSQSRRTMLGGVRPSLTCKAIGKYRVLA